MVKMCFAYEKSVDHGVEIGGILGIAETMPKQRPMRGNTPVSLSLSKAHGVPLNSSSIQWSAHPMRIIMAARHRILRITGADILNPLFEICGDTHDEEEEWEDEVARCESVPCRMAQVVV